MAQNYTDAEWRSRIGARIKELRELKPCSLSELARATGDKLTKSGISNYEQGLRLPGPREAVILAQALGESPAHIMCLDDDMPALSPLEVDLIKNLRALPENERAQYADRIAALALAYKKPIPDPDIKPPSPGPSSGPRRRNQASHDGD